MGTLTRDSNPGPSKQGTFSRLFFTWSLSFLFLLYRGRGFFLCPQMRHMKGFRICRPQICHLGISIILSWRHLGNSRYKKGSLASPFPPKSRSSNSHEKIALPVPGRGRSYDHQRIGATPKRICANKLSKVSYLLLVCPMYFSVTIPQFTTHASFNPDFLFFCLVTSLQFFILYQKGV